MIESHWFQTENGFYRCFSVIIWMFIQEVLQVLEKSHNQRCKYLHADNCPHLCCYHVSVIVHSGLHQIFVS